MSDFDAGFLLGFAYGAIGVLVMTFLFEKYGVAERFVKKLEEWIAKLEAWIDD